MTWLIILFFTFFALALPLRLLYVLSHRHNASLQSRTRCKTAVFLGSGGHTGEMIRLLSGLDFERYEPRVYLVSAGDTMSLHKLRTLEQTKAAGQYSVLELPRARRVHQSFWTAPVTTAWSLLFAMYHCCLRPIVSSKDGSFADVLLLNGPGTCVPLAAACLLSRMCALQSPKIIYIESFARVSTLSLSGKLLRPLADRFVVHWPQLARNLAATSRLSNLFLAPVEHVPNLLLPAPGPDHAPSGS